MSLQKCGARTRPAPPGVCVAKEAAAGHKIY